MGSSASEQKEQQQNEWQRYEAQLQSDKPSQVPPYSRKELTYLEELFNVLDKKNLKSIEVKDMDQLAFLRDHPLNLRIKELFEDQMRKIKAKRINFELFLFLLSVFHPATPTDSKLRFLFRLYDCDRNMKIDSADLTRIYRLLYPLPYFQEEDYSKLVTQTLIRYGTKGQIKLESLLEALPADEIKEQMSFKFSGKFV